jgi:hypothetical protein
MRVCGIGSACESGGAGHDRNVRDGLPRTARPSILEHSAMWRMTKGLCMIRHHLAGAAVSLALLLAMPAQAQTAAQPAQPDIPQSYLEAGRDVVILSGLAESFEAIYLEFRERVTQTVATTRPEVRKDMDEVIEALRPEAEKKRQEIIASAAYIFAKRMSEADLKEVAAFFRSPVGQRYNAMRPRAIDEIFALLQPWSLQTSNFLFDRFSEEMRKRGHKL